jgi:hypothetical protein
MLIKCPECEFTRSVPEEKIPPGSEFATCPKCQTRFHLGVLRGSKVMQDSPADEPEAPGPKAGRDKGRARAAKGSREIVSPGSREEDKDIWSAVESLKDHWDKEKKEPDQPAPQPVGVASQGKKRELLANEGSIPWEYSGVFPYPQGLLRSISLEVTRPTAFFREVSPKGSLLPALLFALLMYAAFFGVLRAINPAWPVPAPDGTHTVLYPLEMLTQSLTPGKLILFLLFCFLLTIFFNAWVVSMLTRLMAPGKENFRVTFKITAYATLPLLLYPLPLVGGLAGTVLGAYLLCLGLRQAYRLEWSRAVLVFILYFLLGLVLMLLLLRLAAG